MHELSPKTAENLSFLVPDKGSRGYKKGGPGGACNTTAGPDHKCEGSASMNESADTRIPSGEQSQIPTFGYDQAEAADTFAAYIAILAHERLDPSLLTNPAWVKLRQAAYAQWFCAYTVIQ